VGTYRQPVLVTTEHRGVFFGYLIEDNAPVSVTLTSARNCLYWSKEVGGFMGLASLGPIGVSRVGAKTERVKLFDITSILDVSPEAEKVWNQK